jgi:hypothetical protein
MLCSRILRRSSFLVSSAFIAVWILLLSVLKLIIMCDEWWNCVRCFHLKKEKKKRKHSSVPFHELVTVDFGGLDWDREHFISKIKIKIGFVLFIVLLHMLEDIDLLVHLWDQGDDLSVKVNKLSSTKTQLPYDYYYLKYCKPTKIVNSAENLGEVLRGDRIENSIYTVGICYLILYQLDNI